MKTFLFVLMALPYLVAMSVDAHDSGQQQDHISVVGVGEVEQEPDRATLNISISARQPSLVAAKQLADERYRSVLAVIKQADISDKFVKVTRVVAQPEYEWRGTKRDYKGELVERSLSVNINNLEKVSPLMQALVENGVSEITGLQSGFQDPKALQQKALAAAADDARSKAKFLAERLGRNLGSAYLISEQNSTVPQPLAQESTMMAKSMSADVAPPPEMFGTQKVQAIVNVSFNLL